MFIQNQIHFRSNIMTWYDNEVKCALDITYIIYVCSQTYEALYGTLSRSLIAKGEGNYVPYKDTDRNLKGMDSDLKRLG